MRKIIFFTILVAFCFINFAMAQSPPFETITITGKTKDTFTKVSLFEKGGSKVPFKTEDVFYLDGGYKIEIKIPDDMKKKDNYFFTDMRFWTDKNENGKKDPGEDISECHFIMWYPEYNKVFLQVYKGQRYDITESNFTYDYSE